MQENREVDKLFSIDEMSWLCLALCSLFLLVYFYKRKMSSPIFIDIRKILSDYKGIYINKWDFRFVLVVPSLLALATSFKRPMNDNISDVLCVVISILGAAVISFMAMTSDRYDKFKEKKNKNLADRRNQIRCMESLSVGLFETLLVVSMLVLVFARPIVESHEKTTWLFGTVIYVLFYQFLFNLFVMMRRLHQIYSEDDP